MRSAAVLVTAVLVSLSGCGDDDDGGSWPAQLYLAPLDSELTVQLVELKPAPY